MTIVTVRPSSDVNITGQTVIPSGTGHAVLSDNDPNSFLNTSAGPAALILGWPAPTSPSAGSVVKQVRFKLSYAGLGFIRNIKLTVGGVSKTSGDLGTPPSTAPYEIGRWDGFSGGTATTESDTYPDIFTTGAQINVFEAYLDWVYVQKPFELVTAPTDGSTITTNRPTVSVQAYFDADGLMPTNYQTQIFAGTGSPGTATPVIDSGIRTTSGGTLSPPFTGPQTFRDDETVLANGSYRAYGRIAHTVNGTLLWGDWVFSSFTVAADAPDVPDFTLTPQPEQARMRIDLQGHNGSAVNNVFLQVQRSVDGGVTWEFLRTTIDDGYILAIGDPGLVTDPSPVTAWDYEGGNGQPVSYRARGVYQNFFVPNSDITLSAWSGKQTDSWEDPLANWIKNPANPAQNFQVVLQSYAGKSTAVRQGVIQPLGARLPIVVADTRGGATGDLTILSLSDVDRGILDELIGANAPVLLQVGPNDHEPDRYMVLGDQTRARVVDKAWVDVSTDQLAWVEVERPEGVLAWDTVHYMDELLSLQPEWAVDFTDADPGLPANSLNDQFTAADGTVLSSHTADSGDTWTQHSTAATTLVVTSNRVRPNTSALAIYYSSDVPASANYVVEGQVRVVTNVGGQSFALNARLSTGADTMYQLLGLGFGGTRVDFYLLKRVAGTQTILAGPWQDNAMGAGTDRTIQLKVQEDGVAGVIQGVTQLEATDTAITAVGRAAVQISGGTSTTGFHMNYVQSRPIKTGIALDRTAGGRDLTLIGEFIDGVSPSVPSVGQGSLLSHQSPEKGAWGSLAAWSYQPFAANAERTFVGMAIHTGDNGVPCYFGSLPAGATNVSTVMEGVNDGGFIHRVHYNSDVNVMGVFGSAIWYDVLPEHEWFHYALTVRDNVPTGYQTIRLFINGENQDNVHQVNTGTPGPLQDNSVKQVKWDAATGPYLMGMRGQGSGQIATGHAVEGSHGAQAVFTRILTDDEIRGLAQAAGLF